MTVLFVGFALLAACVFPEAWRKQCHKRRWAKAREWERWDAEEDVLIAAELGWYRARVAVMLMGVRP